MDQGELGVTYLDIYPETNLNDFYILSLNVNGIQDLVKRRMVFSELKKYKRSIICLQETHINSAILPIVKCQWGRDLFVLGDSTQAGGLAVLMSKDLNIKAELIGKDRCNRFMIVRLSKREDSIILVNIYSPTADREFEQLALLDRLEGELIQYLGEKFVFTGDFNVIIKEALERMNYVGDVIRNTKFRDELMLLLQGFDMVDPWRIRNQKKHVFTWSRGNKASRLDYIFVSDCLQGKISKIVHVDVPFSDHRMIYMGFQSTENNSAKGFWKINNVLLEIPKVQEVIFELIRKKKLEYVGIDPVLKWELLKFDIRDGLIRVGLELKKERDQMRQGFEKRIKELTELGDLLGEEIEEMNALKRELCSIQKTSETIRLYKAKCNWAMYGGKPSKFFLNLEKSRVCEKNISQIFDKDGQLITNFTDILRVQKEHFEQIYKLRVEDSWKEDQFSSEPNCRLEQMDRDVLDLPLTIEELYDAIKDMKLNKCPGTDGLSVEFYRKFWKELSIPMFDCLNEVFRRGFLSEEQKRGIITLIPKKSKDRRYMSNWRPITLLNVDYKILTKVLAKRLMGVISSLIHPDQVGFLRGRFIGVNIRNINDVVEFLQNEMDEGMVVSLDYAKAFDSVDKGYLLKVLQSYNFGEGFIRWVNILYTGVQSCVLNNGVSTGWFHLHSGLRQGCPISPYLFLLAIEKLAYKIRKDPGIEGVEISGNVHKTSLYADDMTLFLKNGKSLENVLVMLDKFKDVSGLAINYGKSFGLQFGNNIQTGLKGSEIQWVEKISVLGLNFYKHKSESEQVSGDMKGYYEKMKKVCETWKRRKLPLKAKVTVLNVLVFPIIYYAASNRCFNDDMFKEVKKIATDFLWNGNSAKIAYKTLTLPIADGGLGLHDFELRIRAARVAWVKRIVSSDTGFWLDYLRHKFGKNHVTEIFLRRKRMVLQNIPKFYQDIVKEWQKIYVQPPNTDLSCRAEPLWDNRFINLRSLSRLQCIWKAKGIFCINDILCRGEIMSANQFCEKYRITHNQSLFDKLARYIPEEFLSPILPLDRHNRLTGLFIPDSHGTMTDLGKISTKELYEILLQRNKKVPTARARWKEYFINDGIVQTDDIWKFWNLVPYQLSREVKLQSFQFRILNRILPCNEYLKRIRVKDSDLCEYCGEEDNIFHFLYECPDTISFWSELAGWLEQFLDLIPFPKEIMEYDFLFGLQGSSIEISRINYVFLLGKFFVYRQKLFDNNNLDVYQFLCEFKNILAVEKMACIREGSSKKKFNKVWKTVYERL